MASCSAAASRREAEKAIDAAAASRHPGRRRRSASLSGGNQQKVVLGPLGSGAEPASAARRTLPGRRCRRPPRHHPGDPQPHRPRHADRHLRPGGSLRSRRPHSRHRPPQPCRRAATASPSAISEEFTHDIDRRRNFAAATAKTGVAAGIGWLAGVGAVLRSGAVFILLAALIVGFYARRSPPSSISTT